MCSRGTILIGIYEAQNLAIVFVKVVCKTDYVDIVLVQAVLFSSRLIFAMVEIHRFEIFSSDLLFTHFTRFFVTVDC